LGAALTLDDIAHLSAIVALVVGSALAFFLLKGRFRDRQRSRKYARARFLQSLDRYNRSHTKELTIDQDIFPGVSNKRALITVKDLKRARKQTAKIIGLQREYREEHRELSILFKGMDHAGY
jgi:polyphosphate kinase 2 (PPK2 family)